MRALLSRVAETQVFTFVHTRQKMFKDRPVAQRRAQRSKQRIKLPIANPYVPSAKLVQTKIDAGQRSLDPIFCKKCNMIYAANDKEESNLHDKFHNEFLKALSFPVSKQVSSSLVSVVVKFSFLKF